MTMKVENPKLQKAIKHDNALNSNFDLYMIEISNVCFEEYF